MGTLPQIILASSSPRRRELLTRAGVPFEVCPSSVAEDFPADMPVNEVPGYLAVRKAQAVRQKAAGGAIILAADTVVVLGNQILGKPQDETEAMATLRQLSGRVHQVITGVCICQDDRRETFSETTQVFFRELTDAYIRHYVHTWRPLDKAGAYAIQEWIGLVGITHIQGDYCNVVGLPVNRVIAALARFHWDFPFSGLIQ